MRAAALALVAFLLPVAVASAADGPGGFEPEDVSSQTGGGELGPCATDSGAASFDRIAACTDLVRIGRASYAVYVARASAYADGGDRAAAVADLTIAIQLRPDGATAYAMRGALYLKDAAFRDGLADLDRAIEIAPGDEAALRTRAFAWDELRAYPAAIADYTALIALTGDDSYRYFRGFASFHHGEPAQALSDFEAILTSRVPTVAAWGYRGRATVREQAGAFPDALSDYTMALALDPSDDRAFLGRCRVAAAVGEREQPGCAASMAAATR